MDDSERSKWLRGEIEQWRREGLVDDDLAKSLDDRYRASAEAISRRSPTGAVVAMLGSVLLGAGIIAFFASNWDYLPGWAKLGLVLAAMVASDAAGFRLRYVGTTYHGTGNALLFLGMPIFGATIFLVAQGYHVNAGAPGLLWLWAAGVAPMAVLLRSRIQWAAALVVGGLALGWESVDWVPWVPALVLSTFLVYGPLLGALADVLSRNSRLAVLGPVTENTGNLLTLWALVPLGFRGVLEYVDDVPGSGYEPGYVWRALLLVLIALGLSAWAWRGSARRWIDHGLFLARVGTVLLAVVPASLRLDDLPWVVWTNVWNLALVLGMVAYGFATRRPLLVNQAVLLFTIQTGCRYVDLFWETLPPEVFFLSMGALLLVGGMAIERGRRRLIERLGAVPLESGL
jgi:uncharacterized membrane protein